MGNIKVLQVNKLYAPHIGGIEKVVQDLAEGLNDRVDMEVLVCQQKRGKTSVERINGVKVTKAGSFGILFSMPLSISFFSHLRKLSRDKDIVHFHMPFPLGDAAFFLSGYKGKVVIWWHSDIIHQKFFMSLYKPIMERFLKRADCIIVATEGHINGSHYLSPYRDKCVIIPFGINIETVLKKAEKSTSPISDAKKSIKLLFIGRLVYYKGVDVLLNAFSNVHGAQLIIVGDGPLKAQLEHQAKDLGVDGNVIFLGRVDDDQIRNLLNECDLLILPSVANSEAFGLVQIEAMACSKPVINTSLPTGVPYVSIHEQTGLTVPPGDVKALSEAIQRLIDNDTERIRMGIRAKERVDACFTLDAMLNNVYKQYQRILEI